MVAAMDRAGDQRALDWLTAGAAASFCVDVDGSLRCRVCGFSQLPEHALEAIVDRGPTAADPATHVLSVRCPGCGERGVALLDTGSAASAGHRALLRRLDVPAPRTAPTPR